MSVSACEKTPLWKYTFHSASVASSDSSLWLMFSWTCRRLSFHTVKGSEWRRTGRCAFLGQMDSSVFCLLVTPMCVHLSGWFLQKGLRMTEQYLFNDHIKQINKQLQRLISVNTQPKLYSCNSIEISGSGWRLCVGSASWSPGGTRDDTRIWDSSLRSVENRQEQYLLGFSKKSLGRARSHGQVWEVDGSGQDFCLWIGKLLPVRDTRKTCGPQRHRLQGRMVPILN